ncbi:MAG TPA: universal stress protein, partial [Streptosporangiaceae bacterium]
MNSAHGKPRIVVGVDESPASLAALRWAAREAGLRATRLQVVRAWERARWRLAPYASRVRPGGRDEDRA